MLSSRSADVLIVMKWQSTIWKMRRKELVNYLAKHRARINRLYAKVMKNPRVKDDEMSLFQDLLAGYGLYDDLYDKQEEFYQSQIEKLKRRVQDLEGRLHLNPENSHKPPSSCRHKKIKNSREKTGRKPGAQPGHAGIGPIQYDTADSIQRDEPQICRSCKSPLKDVPVHEVIIYQLIDMKDGDRYIKQFERVVKYCPNCGDLNRGDLPAEFGRGRAIKVFGDHVKSIAIYFLAYQMMPLARTQEIFSDLYGIAISQGTLAQIEKEFGAKLLDWEISTKSQLINSALLHADETGIRCEKRNDFTHVLSSQEVTLLSHDKNRGFAAQNRIGILPEYKGHLVHDGFKSYDQYATCTHSLCNAHILRELKYLTEEEKQAWSSTMATLLKETLHKLHQTGVSSINIKKLKSQYAKILKDGYKEAGYAAEWKGRPPDGYKKSYESGKLVKIPTFKRRKLNRAMNLLNRLRDSSEQILAFAMNEKIPFTNNQAERDLRMLKVKEKISGCFRTEEMAKHFLRIRSFLSTMKKQENPLLDSIFLAFVLEV